MTNSNNLGNPFQVLKPNLPFGVAAMFGAIASVPTLPENLSLGWAVAAVAATGATVGYGAKLGRLIGARGTVFIRRQILSFSSNSDDGYTRTGPLSPVQERFILDQINAGQDMQKQMKASLVVLVAGTLIGSVAGGVITYKVANPAIDRFAAAHVQKFSGPQPT
jgi:hypothetical protein